MMGIFIELDRRRELRYTEECIVALAKEMARRGKDIATLKPGPGLTKEDLVTAIVWAGLLHEDPGLTPGRVNELIRTYFIQHEGSQEAQQSLSDSINEALAEARAMLKKRRRPKLRMVY